MIYNLNWVRGIMMETHPKFGDMGFYLERPMEIVEVLGLDDSGKDITISHPKRFGINILGRPDVNVEDIQGFCDTMKYMGMKPYYWDYDKWGMLFFEFELNVGDDVYYEFSDVIGARR